MTNNINIARIVLLHLHTDVWWENVFIFVCDF